MPRQNRVSPYGDLLAVPERGTFLGNRGVLHDEEGHIRRAWQGKRWIICVLTFRGRKRPVMTPGRYTELFFLDEATALAAGHRPCAECRRDCFNTFRAAWRLAHGGNSDSPLPGAEEIDGQLHSERIAPDGSRWRFRAALDELPDGVFVQHPECREDVCLVWNGGLLIWTAGGYTRRYASSKSTPVLVVTPPSTVGVLHAGYVPVVHPSAHAQSG